MFSIPDTTAVLAHRTLAFEIFEYVDMDAIKEARLEFPAALVPLQPGLVGDPDDRIEMEIVCSEDGTMTLAKVMYGEYESDYFDDARCPEWTLYDAHRRACYSVLFHDIDDGPGWCREHVDVTIVSPCNERIVEDIRGKVAHLDVSYCSCY